MSILKKRKRADQEVEQSAMKITFKNGTRADKIFLVFNYAILSILLVIWFYPLWYCLIASVSDVSETIRGHVWLWPVKPNLSAYEAAFSNARLMLGFKNSVINTTLSTLWGLILLFPIGYAMSRNDLPGRKFFLIILLIPMYFSGGMIPNYLLYRDLGLLNTRSVLIITGACSTYSIIVVQTYFRQNIPSELLDCAKLDGCGDVRFFMSVAVPLARPIIAVMALQAAVGCWNSFSGALLYTNDPDLANLQLVLRDLLFYATATEEQLEQMTQAQRTALSDLNNLLRYATLIIGVVPMLCIYPFIQKHFIKGMLVGSVKG